MKTLALLAAFFTLIASARSDDALFATALDITYALEKKEPERLYSFASESFKRTQNLEQFNAVISKSDIDGISIIHAEFGADVALCVVSVRRSGSDVLTYSPIAFVKELGAWKYLALPHSTLRGPDFIEKFVNGIRKEE